MRLFRSALLLGLHIVVLGVCAQDGPLRLPVTGRVTDADKKLQGCDVLVYKGNDLMGRHTTDGNGRFSFALGMQDEFAIEFRKEGYLSKRVLVDTHAELPTDLVRLGEVAITMSMLPASRYAGADTDELDFPFAILRYDPETTAFVHDQEYTAGMMRTNGALLLMSGHAAKQR